MAVAVAPFCLFLTHLHEAMVKVTEAENSFCSQFVSSAEEETRSTKAAIPDCAYLQLGALQRKGKRKVTRKWKRGEISKGS